MVLAKVRLAGAQAREAAPGERGGGGHAVGAQQRWESAHSAGMRGTESLGAEKAPRITLLTLPLALSAA